MHPLLSLTGPPRSSLPAARYIKAAMPAA